MTSSNRSPKLKLDLTFEITRLPLEFELKFGMASIQHLYTLKLEKTETEGEANFRLPPPLRRKFGRVFNLPPWEDYSLDINLLRKT